MIRKRNNSTYSWFSSAVDSDAYTVPAGDCIMLCLSDTSDDEDYVTSSSSDVRPNHLPHKALLAGASTPQTSQELFRGLTPFVMALQSEFESDWLDPLWVVDDNEVLERREWAARQARQSAKKQRRGSAPKTPASIASNSPQLSSSPTASPPASADSSSPSPPTIHRALSRSDRLVSTGRAQELVELDQQRMFTSTDCLVIGQRTTASPQRCGSSSPEAERREARRAKVKPIRLSGSYAKLHLLDSAGSPPEPAKQQMEESADLLPKVTGHRRKHSLGKILSLPFRRATLPGPWIAPTTTTTSSSSPPLSSSPTTTTTTTTSSNNKATTLSSTTSTSTSPPEASMTSTSLLSPRAAVRPAPATMGFSLSSRKKRAMSLRPQSVGLFQEMVQEAGIMGDGYRALKEMEDCDSPTSGSSSGELDGSGEQQLFFSSGGFRSRSKNASGSASSLTTSSGGGTVRSFTRAMKTSLPDFGKRGT